MHVLNLSSKFPFCSFDFFLDVFFIFQFSNNHRKKALEKLYKKVLRSLYGETTPEGLKTGLKVQICRKTAVLSKTSLATNF